MWCLTWDNFHLISVTASMGQGIVVIGSHFVYSARTMHFNQNWDSTSLMQTLMQMYLLAKRCQLEADKWIKSIIRAVVKLFLGGIASGLFVLTILNEQHNQFFWATKTWSAACLCLTPSPLLSHCTICLSVCTCLLPALLSPRQCVSQRCAATGPSHAVQDPDLPRPEAPPPFPPAAWIHRRE